MRPSLYVDEDITTLVAVSLRTRGFDAVSAYEAGMDGATDEEQLAYAAAHGRVMITSNFHDFVPMALEWAANHREHAGLVIVFDRVDRARAGAAADACIELLEPYSGGDLHGITLALPPITTA